MSYYKLGDNFKWFIARVSDLKDPEYLGRVKIRVIHQQTGELGKVKEGKSGISNEDLLWAWPLSGIQSASLSWKKLVEEDAGLEEFDTPDWIDAVGISPTGIAKGTYVFGFYLDAFEQNLPIIFGTYHKRSIYPEPPSDDVERNSFLQLKPTPDPKFYSDVAALARGEEGDGGQTLPKEPYTQAKVLTNTSEPASAYKTEYPYNTTYTTKSGHAIELDDTVNHERIHVWHQSGSYEEIANGPPGAGEKFEGRRVKKTVGNDYEIVILDKNILIKENLNEEIEINVNTEIGNNHFCNIGNNSTTTIGNNHVLVIGNNSTTAIGNNHVLSIANDSTTTIGNNHVLSIANDSTTTIGNNCVGSIGNNIAISIGNNGLITIGDNLEMETGGNTAVTVGKTLRILAGESLRIEAPGGIVLTDGSLTVANGSITTSAGATGDFEDPNGKTISVVQGIITEIKG